MSDESHIPHPEAKEQFGENIPEEKHKHESTPGKHPSLKYNLEKDPIHVEGNRLESDLVEELKLMPRGEDMHRWSGALLMGVIIFLILIIGLGIYFTGSGFIKVITDLTTEP